MPVRSTTAQFNNLREVATRPITLIRWEHSGGLELLSCSGDVQFDGEFYLSGHINLDRIEGSNSATITMPATAERMTECVSGAWRGNKVCQIYEIPATVDDEDYVYDEDDAILKLDGIIDNSSYSNGTITVSVLHKYLVSRFTPRNYVNEFTTTIPAAGSFIKVGSSKYQLSSRRAEAEQRRQRLLQSTLRGRLTTQEINSFTPSDKVLDVETSADGALLPIVYGRVPIPGMICANGVDISGNFIFVVAWCFGQIFDVADIYNNDAALPSDAIVHTYRGLKCQGVDNYAASIVSLTYTDTWKLTTAAGTACACYSVIRLPSTTTDAPRFQAVVRGRLVYDLRHDVGATLLNAGAFPDPYNKGDIAAVGYNLQFIGTNGTSPATGMDFSSYAHTITWAGNAQIQSNKLSLDGTGDYVTVPNNTNTRFGTGRWTLEITCTPSNTAEINALFGVGNSTNDRCIQFSQLGTELYVNLSSNGTTWDIAATVQIGTNAFAAATTTYIVIEFDGRGYFFYVNGAQKHYIASTSSLYASTATIQIGRNQTTASGDEFKGTITGARFTKGYLRYGGVHTATALPYPDSDSNESGYVYSDTAGMCVADLIKNPFYGLGATESIENLLNLIKYNETDLSGGPRDTVSMVIAEKRQTIEWLDLLCGTYASGFWFPEGAGITVIPDRIANKYNPSGWEITTNGDFFDDAGDWTLGSGWMHIAVHHFLLASAASSSVSQTMGKPTVAGDVYVITLSLDACYIGSLRVDLDGMTVIDAQTTAGVFAYEFTATGTETTVAAVGVSFYGIVGELTVRRKFWRDDTIVDGSLTITPHRNADTPNRIIASFRKIVSGTANWTDDIPVTINMPGVGVDDMPVTETRIRYDGLKSTTKATLKAKTKLYRMQGRNTIAWKTTDAGLLYRKGMVIELYDAEYDRTLYVLLESIERVEQGRYQCRGIEYSDSHYPQDVTAQAGTVPVGLILPLLGSTVPSGWQAYTAADGKYIKCAGESVAVASTGGTTTRAALTGSTSTDGAHGAGEETFPVKSFIGTSGSGVGRRYTATENDAGSHSHTYNTGTITPDLFYQGLILAEKITSAATTLPPEVLAFGVNVACLDTLRYTAYDKRLFRAAATPASGGVLLQMLQLTTDDASDIHDHHTYSNITNGSPAGTAVTAPHYVQMDGGSVHSHAIALEIIRHVKRHKLALYGSGTIYGMGQGMVGFWKGALTALHQDYTLCDGRLGTPFIEGRLLEVAAPGEEGQRRGNNTIIVEGTSRWSLRHDHDGDMDNTDTYAVVEMSHSNDLRHRHTIRNPALESLDHNDWEPPFHALYTVMYNPNPVAGQRDVQLYIDGDQPDGTTTILDVSASGYTAMLAGGGSLSYSDDQLLFGLNTLHTTGGRRASFGTFTWGKKWTVRGFFRNAAAGGITYLFSNKHDGFSARSYSVVKSASGHIELYIGETLRATVTLGVTANEWYYVELCYDYAEFRLYAGKVSSGIASRATYATAAFDAYPQFGIFDVPQGWIIGIAPFVGYASHIQVVTGAALHSESMFKIPTRRYQNWHSSHYLLGAYDWWDPLGVVDGHYTNLLPDLDPKMLPNNSGARSSMWRETGSANVKLRLTWPGVHDAAGDCGIMACVVPSATDFALGFNYESALNAWVLWKLGKQPDNISVLSFTAGAHTSGVPVVLSVEISGTTITCKADGVTMITATIPVALQGSTKHGVFVDVNRVPGRPANLPGLRFPLRVNQSNIWVMESGTWSDAGVWLDHEEWI